MNSLQTAFAAVAEPALAPAFAAALEWCSDGVTHVDRLQLSPAALHADGRWHAAGAEAGATGSPVALDAAAWCRPAGLPRIALDVGDLPLPTGLYAGRHYPAHIFGRKVAGPREQHPVRLLRAGSDGALLVDPNHPLAARNPRLILEPSSEGAVRGMRLATLFDGPGMQAVAEAGETCYFPAGALARRDASADIGFYSRPRRIQHLDARCRAGLEALYARLLPPGGRVLDLMASHDSHLPAPCDFRVAGLGLNQEELAANGHLADRVVQDLNACSLLPWDNATFDAVICTAAIEYLVRPHDAMREVRRVLKPGGLFAVSFSDRWFPTKAIAVWAELHPFERLGLVLHLLKSSGFVGLRSETRRGLPRPADDKYAAERAFADPLFAAWGYAP